MAGSDLPDILYMYSRPGASSTLAAAAGVPQFLQSQAADLTPHLAGDAARDYPNLAAIPTQAWKNAGCAYNGKLYMWPLQRYLPGTAFIRNIDLWNQEFGTDYLPKNADDFKRMLLHSELAEAVGVPPEAIFRVENGTPLEITADGASLGNPETAGMVFVDGVDIGDVADVALRDRRMLSADGIFIIVATISEQDGSSVVAPEVLARGVPFLDDDGQVIDELREAVEDSLDRAAEQRVTEIDVLESMLHDDIAAFLYGKLKRRPMVLPVVVEV